VEYRIGILLAFGVVVSATLIGPDRERAFYPTVHHRFISNPGVPAWCPGFCLAFDVVARRMVCDTPEEASCDLLN